MPGPCVDHPFIHAVFSGGDEPEADLYIDAVSSIYRPTHYHSYKPAADVVLNGFADAYANAWEFASARNMSLAMTVLRPLRTIPYESLDAAILDPASGIQQAFEDFSVWVAEVVARPVLLRPFHEFLNGLGPGGDKLGYSGPAGHIEAWRLLHDIVSAGPGGSMVSWVWNPQAFSDGMGNNLGDYWPGADTVDFAGHFLHNDVNSTQFANAQVMADFARSKGVLLYIPEFSPNGADFPDAIRTPGVIDLFYQPFAQWMLDNADVIRGTEFQNRSLPEDLLITHPDMVAVFDFWKGMLAALSFCAPPGGPIGGEGRLSRLGGRPMMHSWGGHWRSGVSRPSRHLRPMRRR